MARIAAALAGTLTMLGMMLGAALPALAEDTLAKVKSAGVLVVGVKNDYRPWGFLDPSGKIVGFEIDLAREVADAIGVKLELVPVTGANRMEFLERGRIDLIVATMGDTPERRKVIGMIEPNYYAGATNVLAQEAAHLAAWSDLKGRRICAVQGAYYNRRVSQLYQPELVVFPAVPDALKALQTNNCIAFLFDDTFIISTLAASDPQWAGFTMPLASEDPQLWAIGVRRDDLTGPFGAMLSELSKRWHRSGHLIELEAKWGMKASPYLAEAHAKWMAQ